MDQLNYVINLNQASENFQGQFQNPFLASNAPTLVVTPSNIPLYPGYQTSLNQENYNGNTKSKYNQLLAVIEEMSKDIRPIYAGSKSATERFKRGITQSRLLIRECLLETERSNKS
jgi:hypothetical protein